MAEGVAAALARELGSLPDEALRPLAERLAGLTPAPYRPPTLLTVAQAAQRLGVNANTVYRMIGSGRLRGVRVGRLWRIPESELGRVELDAAPSGRVVRLATAGRPGRRFGDLVRELPYAGPRP